MFWTMGRRLIASFVGFFVGWGMFAIVNPMQNEVGPHSRISAITLKRFGCVNAELECPVYEVTFRGDGIAYYTGHANDDLIGKFKADFDAREFAMLVEQFNRQRFFELPTDSGVVGSADSTASRVEERTEIEVVTSDGSRQLTTVNWTDTPPGLRSLQALLDFQTYQMVWDELE